MICDGSVLVSARDNASLSARRADVNALATELTGFLLAFRVFAFKTNRPPENTWYIPGGGQTDTSACSSPFPLGPQIRAEHEPGFERSKDDSKKQRDLIHSIVRPRHPRFASVRRPRKCLRDYRSLPRGASIRHRRPDARIVTSNMARRVSRCETSRVRACAEYDGLLRIVRIARGLRAGGFSLPSTATGGHLRRHARNARDERYSRSLVLATTVAGWK